MRGNAPLPRNVIAERGARSERRFRVGRRQGELPLSTRARQVSGYYQQEACEIWCPEPESNQRHVDFQSTALPTELSGLQKRRVFN